MAWTYSTGFLGVNSLSFVLSTFTVTNHIPIPYPFETYIEMSLQQNGVTAATKKICTGFRHLICWEPRLILRVRDRPLAERGSHKNNVSCESGPIRGSHHTHRHFSKKMDPNQRSEWPFRLFNLVLLVALACASCERGPTSSRLL